MMGPGRSSSGDYSAIAGTACMPPYSWAPYSPYAMYPGTPVPSFLACCAATDTLWPSH